MKTLCQTILTSTHFLDAKIKKVRGVQIADVVFLCPTCGAKRDFQFINHSPIHVPPEGTKCGAKIDIPDGTCPKCKGQDALHKVRHPGTFRTPECWTFICTNCDFETDPE